MARGELSVSESGCTPLVGPRAGKCRLCRNYDDPTLCSGTTGERSAVRDKWPDVGLSVEVPSGPTPPSIPSRATSHRENQGAVVYDNS